MQLIKNYKRGLLSANDVIFNIKTWGCTADDLNDICKIIDITIDDAVAAMHPMYVSIDNISGRVSGSAIVESVVVADDPQDGRMMWIKIVR